MKENYIGRLYCPLDNSYSYDKTNHINNPRVRGQKYMVIANPYKEQIETFVGKKVEEFVDVISFKTGFVYRVLYDERWFVGERKSVFKDKQSLIGKKMLILDNSYIYEIPNPFVGMGDIYYPHIDLYGRVVEIVSEPYLDKKFFENDKEGKFLQCISKGFSQKTVFVTVLHEKRVYRVPLLEEGLDPLI